MSEVSFEIIRREPMCQYCTEFPASHYVITVSGGVEQRYAACMSCREAVQNGLHECDYNCEDDHAHMIQRPADPGAHVWLTDRLFQSSQENYWLWTKAGCPPLREENGAIVWDRPTATIPQPEGA